MKTYTYKFADGTKSVVMVSDELYEVLTELDKEEKFGNRRETRRHVSVERLAEQGIEPAVTDKYDFGDWVQDLRNEKLSSALEQLNFGQRELIRKVFFEQTPLKEIAGEEKVSLAAISMRLSATLSQLRINR